MTKRKPSIESQPAVDVRAIVRVRVYPVLERAVEDGVGGPLRTLRTIAAGGIVEEAELLPVGEAACPDPHEADARPGEERGAPERPQLLRKAVITSLVAAALWLGFYFLHRADIFSFRAMVGS